jgi:hypothetical protein
LNRNSSLETAPPGNRGPAYLFICSPSAITRVFAVDTDILRCYNAQKDKVFGGESPNELQNAVASEAADLPGRAGLLSR